MKIRTLGPGDEQGLRQIRLASLADSPSAFGSTQEAELAFSPEHWTNLVTSGSEAVLVAEDGDRWWGLTGVGADWDDDTFTHIWGMWVDPEARRGGVGAALLDAAIEWARGRGSRGVRLWVAETNTPAETLYASRGFARTGVTRLRPHPPDPQVTEIALELLF